MKGHLLKILVIVSGILLGWYAFALGQDLFLVYLLGVAPLILAVVHALDQKRLNTSKRP